MVNKLYTVHLLSPIPYRDLPSVTERAAAMLGKDPAKVKIALSRDSGDVISPVSREKAERYADIFRSIGLDVIVVSRHPLRTHQNFLRPGISPQKRRDPLLKRFFNGAILLLAVVASYELGVRSNISVTELSLAEARKLVSYRMFERSSGPVEMPKVINASNP